MRSDYVTTQLQIELALRRDGWNLSVVSDGRWNYRRAALDRQGRKLPLIASLTQATIMASIIPLPGQVEKSIPRPLYREVLSQKCDYLPSDDP